MLLQVCKRWRATGKAAAATPVKSPTGLQASATCLQQLQQQGQSMGDEPKLYATVSVDGVYSNSKRVRRLWAVTCYASWVGGSLCPVAE